MIAPRYSGARRGVRLIDLDSLDAHIEAQSATAIEPWARALQKPSPPKRRQKLKAKP